MILSSYRSHILSICKFVFNFLQKKICFQPISPYLKGQPYFFSLNYARLAFTLSSQNTSLTITFFPWHKTISKKNRYPIF